MSLRFDEPVCEYWSEVEYGNGRTAEYCKKVNHSCTCSGTREECDNGEYIPQIVEDYLEDR